MNERPFPLDELLEEDEMVSSAYEHIAGEADSLPSEEGRA